MIMFLSAYHFDGDDSAALAAAHDRLLIAQPPASFTLHLCAVGERGIVVLDTCPNREVFEEFHRSAGFLKAIADAGLPAPRVERLGEVHSTVLP
jgi:hypothetical protein